MDTGKIVCKLQTCGYLCLPSQSNRPPVNVIAARTIRAYRQAHPKADKALAAWLKTARKAEWQSPEDVQESDPKVSVLKNGRLVFDINGGRYRLVVKAVYFAQIICVRWFGTHQDYDKVDADSV